MSSEQKILLLYDQLCTTFFDIDFKNKITYKSFASSCKTISNNLETKESSRKTILQIDTGIYVFKIILYGIASARSKQLLIKISTKFNERIQESLEDDLTLIVGNMINGTFALKKANIEIS